MTLQQQTKKNDFVEVLFTGYANGEIFDSNIKEDLEKINKDAKPEKLIVIIGKGMVVPGLDKALEDKLLNEEYEISFSWKEGFGQRHRELIKTIPIKSFIEKKINPQPGMVFALDNQVIKVIAVSGARVTADFNNLLAGKDIKYKFKIIKIVADKKEQAETLFKLFLRFVPEFEVKESKAVVKGPKQMEQFVVLFKEKFKELASLDLEFEEKQDA